MRGIGNELKFKLKWVKWKKKDFEDKVKELITLSEKMSNPRKPKKGIC